MDSAQQVSKTLPADNTDSIEPILLFEAVVSKHIESGTPDSASKSESQVDLDIKGNAYSKLLQCDWLVKHALETRDAPQLYSRIKMLEIATAKAAAAADRYSLAVHTTFSTFEREPLVILNTFTVVNLHMVRLSEFEVAVAVKACCMEPSFGLTPLDVFERLRTSTCRLQYPHYHSAILAVAAYEDVALDILNCLLQDPDVSVSLNDLHFLQACSRAHSKTLARRLLEHCIDHLPTPHTPSQIHFKFSSYYFRGMLAEAVSAFWEYVQRDEAPDDEMLGRMLQTCLRLQRWDDILMLATGPQVLDSAQGLSRSLPVDGVEVLFQALLHFQRWEDAFHTFQRALEAQKTQSPALMTRSLWLGSVYACKQSNQCKLWMAMEKLTLTYACGSPSKHKWDFIFSEVIKGIAKCQGVQRAHDFFDALCEFQVVVALPVYNVLLDELWRALDLAKAVQLVDQGIKRKTLPGLHFQIAQTKTLKLILHKLSPGAASAMLVLWLSLIHQRQINGGLSPARLVVIVKKLVSISVEMKDSCFHEVVSDVDSAIMNSLIKALKLPFKVEGTKHSFGISWNAFLHHMPDVRGDPSRALEKTLDQLFAKVVQASKKDVAFCSSFASTSQPDADEGKPCAPSTLKLNPDAPEFVLEPGNILQHSALEIKPPASSILKLDAPDFKPCAPGSTLKPDTPEFKLDFTGTLQLGAPQLEPLVPGSTPQPDAREIMKHSKLSKLAHTQKAPQQRRRFSEEASRTEAHIDRQGNDFAKGSCESNVDPSFFERRAATDVDTEMDTSNTCLFEKDACSRSRDQVNSSIGLDDCSQQGSSAFSSWDASPEKVPPRDSKACCLSQRNRTSEASVSQCSPEAKITECPEQEELVAELYARAIFFDSENAIVNVTISTLVSAFAIILLPLWRHRLRDGSIFYEPEQAFCLICVFLHQNIQLFILGYHKLRKGKSVSILPGIRCFSMHWENLLFECIVFSFFCSPTWIPPVEHAYIKLQVIVVALFGFTLAIFETQRSFQSLPSDGGLYFAALVAMHLFQSWRIAANPIGAISSVKLIVLATCIRVILTILKYNYYQKFLRQMAPQVRTMMKARKSETDFPVELVKKIRTYDTTIACKELYEKVSILSGITSIILFLALHGVTMRFRNEFREYANDEFKDWIEANFFNGKGYMRILLCMPFLIACVYFPSHARPTAGGEQKYARKNK